MVAPDRLRFDFTHYEPLSDDEIVSVEDIVNLRVLDNIPVRSSLESFEDAREKGAIALFGEKYGQEVRMIEIEETSCELCGGTHVRSTGEIGGFRIVSESGIAAGVRRIEAVTGEATVEIGRDAARELERVSSVLKVPVRDLEDGARKAVERIKELEKEISGLRQRLAGSEVESILTGVKDVDGIKVAAARIDAPSVELLKHLADRVKESLPGGVVCVGSAAEDKVFIVVSVDPAVAREKGLKASLIAKKLGEMVGGRGGGKDTFAQAGGKDIDMLDKAIEQTAEVVASLVK
jgi:alanyl-tRNA synthetase